MHALKFNYTDSFHKAQIIDELPRAVLGGFLGFLETPLDFPLSISPP